MPDSSPRNRTLWLIVLALIILTLVPFAIHRASIRKDGNASSPGKKTSAQTRTTSQNNLTQRSQRSQRSQRTVSKQLPPSHKTEDLKSFLLPASELSNVTLEEALDALSLQYREICLESGESPISFHYKIKGTPDLINLAKLEGDFLANLKYLAAMAGTIVEIKDNQLLFTEIDDGPVTTRRWTVPPTFWSQLSQLPSDNDPFEGGDIRPKIGIKGLLLGMGAMNENEQVSFLTSSSTLITKAGAKSQSRIDGIVEAAIANTPVQTRLRFTDEVDQLLSIALIAGNLGTIERNHSTPHDSPNMQVLVSAVEQGFGRKIQSVSFTGTPPTEEAKALYLQSGNVADLGLKENLTYATYNIMRGIGDDPQLLTFKDENGTLHEMPFITERIDATGRVIAVPQYEEE